MSCLEQQQEEIEVLNSIYEGDSNFKKISPTCFQYKYGEDGAFKSFIVEITWGEEYPDEAPIVNLDVFYNKHIIKDVQQKIKNDLLEQTEDLITTPMTFSLFEWVKDNLDSLIADQPESSSILQVENKNESSIQSDDIMSDKQKGKKEQKEQMTKAQKRRFFDKFGSNIDRPRGWDWVDVVKHLSQTGGQKIEKS